jgi:hypothetical protein
LRGSRPPHRQLWTDAEAFSAAYLSLHAWIARPVLLVELGVTATSVRRGAEGAVVAEALDGRGGNKTSQLPPALAEDLDVLLRLLARSLLRQGDLLNDRHLDRQEPR